MGAGALQGVGKQEACRLTVLAAAAAVLAAAVTMRVGGGAAIE
jgi:hypothetical protein